MAWPSCASIVSQELAPAVVVVTGHETVEVAALAVRAGAKGFVSKLDHTEELVETIRAVHQGRPGSPNRLLAGILAELQRAAKEDDELVRRLSLLTDREREVLAYLAAGTERAAIARELFISAHTVRTHVQRILTKLGVHSQLEAVSVALRAGLDGPSRSKTAAHPIGLSETPADSGAQPPSGASTPTTNRRRVSPPAWEAARWGGPTRGPRPPRPPQPGSARPASSTPAGCSPAGSTVAPPNRSEMPAVDSPSTNAWSTSRSRAVSEAGGRVAACARR